MDPLLALALILGFGIPMPWVAFKVVDWFYTRRR